MTYYYGGIEDYGPIRWHTADTLKDAVFKARTLLSKGYYEEIEIQIKPIDPPIGVRIPEYRIGCVIQTSKGYIFSRYIAKSFNAKRYSEDYLIKGKSLIPILTKRR